MRKLLLLFTFLLGGSFFASAQDTFHFSVKNIQPKETYENVKVQKLQGDEHTTSFMIWVKNRVKPHRHQTHAEQIYVISGEAVMLLGERELTIEAGDYVFIPKNTVHAVRVTSDEPLKVLSVQAPKFEGKDRVWVDQTF